MQPIINIGILAHVDAGKTTLTENMLYLSGATRTKGSVNNGTAITDSLNIEKKRGISVKLAATAFNWNGVQINLIDTPGHAGFSAEVERCLSILDGAILVVSAVEGVQAHTYALWDALQTMKIPTLIVVNKIDRPGADFSNILDEIKKELGIKPFPLHSPENEGSNNAGFIPLWEGDELLCDASGIKNMAIESIAELDEKLLEQYLDGIIPENSTLLDLAKKYFLKLDLVPVLATVAKENIGTNALLDAVTQYFKSKKAKVDIDFSAMVFKVEHDAKLGRLAHIRVFTGIIKPRNSVYNATQGKSVKVAQLKKVFTQKLQDITELLAGDVGVVSGFTDVMAGNVLGNAQNVPKPTIIQQPVLTVQVKAIINEQYAALANALYLLNVEDPALGFLWYKKEEELHLKLMGAIQTEILQSVILERFGVKCEFTEPTIIYKEIPKTKAEGFAKYTMPKPCWAIVKFIIEPGELGSGVVYKSIVSVDKIARKYQNEVENTIEKALQQGIKGWEVTDIKITLVGNEDHEVHSNPGDFVLATPMGIMNGLKNTNTQLLEPMYNFEIKASEQLLGAITSDLTKMRATFANPKFINGRFILTGKTPVATSIDYSIRLNSLTGGKGKIKLSFGGYKKCTDDQGVIRKYKGVNPLDASQWILHMRGAFKANERK